MGDSSISKIYQFISEYNGNWEKDADVNGDDIITKIEMLHFLNDNVKAWNGEGENTKDLIYKFWKTIDTETSGKVKNGSKINNENSLSDSEMANVEKKIQISEQVDNFVKNHIKGHEPSVITDKNGWLNSVKDGILEKAFNYVNKGNSELTDAKLQEFYELTYRKATADYYFSDLKNTLGNDITIKDSSGNKLYKVGSDSTLEAIINSYVQTLDGDTTTSIESIIAKVDELVNAYKDTADTNSSSSIGTLQTYGYNPNGPLNDLQKAKLTEIMFKSITGYLETNNADYATYKAAGDNAVFDYIETYLSDKNKTAADFVTLKNFSINSVVDTEEFKAILKAIQDAKDGKAAETRAENAKLYGVLANEIANIAADTDVMTKIRNNTYAIHTEFGMDKDGNIVFEQQDTTNVYDKLVSNITSILEQKFPEEYNKIGKDNIKRLIQSAWITTYKHSSAFNVTKSFVEEVMKNLQNVLSKVVEKPEYIDVFTSRTAYANPTLTNGLDKYGNKSTAGNDAIWLYETEDGKQNVTSDGHPSWLNKTDAGEYQATMNKLLENIKNTEPYKELNPVLIEGLFREAQQKALETCSGNVEDCPYGTTSDVDSEIATTKSIVAKENQDWSGTRRADDDWEISPKAIVELTLYYFDKLLYQSLLS